MGNKLLMRNIVLIIICGITVAYSDLSIEQIEQMISKINRQRDGVDLETLEKIKEPFISSEKKDNRTVTVMPSKKMKIKMSLSAIMNGKAYINGSWRRINDMIMGYTLKYIGKRGVVLRKGNQIKKLFLQKKENIIRVK